MTLRSVGFSETSYNSQSISDEDNIIVSITSSAQKSYNQGFLNLQDIPDTGTGGIDIENPNYQYKQNEKKTFNYLDDESQSASFLDNESIPIIASGVAEATLLENHNEHIQEFNNVKKESKCCLLL